MADQKPFEPYVPAETSIKEFTLRAVLLGVVMAVILGAANAYIGMVAGLTIAATFPAAVVALAALRPAGGTILEENIARTTASVGEALVAGAIFTIPAFVIAGVWEGVNIWISTFIMLVGGVLGVLFVIILRRTLVEDAGLPFPESVAAAEIHKAGQKGATGGKYLLRAGLLAALLEFLKNEFGLRTFSAYISGFWSWGAARLNAIGETYSGGIFMNTPPLHRPSWGWATSLGRNWPRWSLRAVCSVGGALRRLCSSLTVIWWRWRKRKGGRTLRSTSYGSSRFVRLRWAPWWSERYGRCGVCARACSPGLEGSSLI